MATATYSPSDAYSVVALLLTLAGLLATFFAVQLSQWVMNMLGVRAKWAAHKDNTGSVAADARRECRAELAGLYNAVTAISTMVVGVFVGFVIYACFAALALVDGGSLKSLLSLALVVFVACYGLLAIGMLAYGYGVGWALNGEVNPSEDA